MKHPASPEVRIVWLLASQFHVFPSLQTEFNHDTFRRDRVSKLYQHFTFIVVALVKLLFRKTV